MKTEKVRVEEEEEIMPRKRGKLKGGKRDGGRGKKVFDGN